MALCLSLGGARVVLDFRHASASSSAPQATHGRGFENFCRSLEDHHSAAACRAQMLLS